MQQRVDLLRHEINKLREEEKVVDDYVAQMTELVQQSMRDQEAKGDKSLAYVTHADITSIPQYANDTVVAVKAPAGTTLEVPDPDDLERAARTRTRSCSLRVLYHGIATPPVSRVE